MAIDEQQHAPATEPEAVTVTPPAPVIKGIEKRKVQATFQNIMGL